LSIFGSDYKGRKNQPIFHFLVRYFPKALAEVTKVCVAGNVQHNPELDPTDINWSRDKSTDQLNTAMRHMMDHATSGPMDTEPESVQKIIGGNTYHLAKAAWRVLAELELQIERDRAPKATTLTEITAAGQGEFMSTWGTEEGLERWEYICRAVDCPGHEVMGGYCEDPLEVLKDARRGVNYGYRLKVIR
jgi:hypothetical protein